MAEAASDNFSGRLETEMTSNCIKSSRLNFLSCSGEAVTRLVPAKTDGVLIIANAQQVPINPTKPAVKRFCIIASLGFQIVWKQVIKNSVSSNPIRKSIQ